ncbi:hypothetical protein F5Y17DRAFT_466756 [Xylariaceae sp. FL0594]|nr:hypothetical protein F5Y17DRAFT_466756 [Xylariaceae sp. FL0594]
MATSRQEAKQSWVQAQRIRSEIEESVSSLKKERSTTQYTTRFQDAEATIAEFRLACLQVIINDFEYAVRKKVETCLWQCHTFLNGEYRRALGRLNTPKQAVQKRKLDKLYRAFLKTSEKFYVVYIQQLHHRFSIPELQQLAYGVEIQPDEEDRKDALPAAPLRGLALKSCQTTLVRLGDLARYQCQASDKVSKAIFDRAVGYYDMANVLNPDDGSAHHQLAILHQALDQHFDIVYHFCRAISISVPHPLALQNLKQEFKHPEGASQAKHRAAKDHSEAMAAWFVRLHAYYFHGKQFSAQVELEDEVLHRVELALKAEGSETVLLKMTLINMAAYDISTERVKASWTMEGSQSCQFLLRFNVRMVLALLRVLQHTLNDEPSAPLSPGTSEGESCIKFGPGLQRLLPLIRLYVAWIYVVRADLVQYQEYLEPQIQEVYGLLADALTSLNLFIDPTVQTISSKYLLPEDTEAQGLRPLSDQKLPLFLNVEEQQRSTPMRRTKVRKPQQKVFGQKFQPETEAVWRIRDIVRCGALLSGSPNFPLNLVVRKHEGRNVEAWKYVEGAAPAMPPNDATLSHLLRKLGSEEPNEEPEHMDKEETTAPQQKAEPINEHVPMPMNGRTEDAPPAQELPRKENYSAKQRPAVYQSSDPSEDTEMVNMVNRLLDPPEDERPHSGEALAESSYGMHSTTANEVFGGLDVSPAQPSPVSRAIPNLPWDYFYKPAQHRSASRENNHLSSNGQSIPRSAAASSPYLGELSASFERALPHGLSPRLNAGHLDRFPLVHSSSPSLGLRDFQMDALEGSRHAVLDSLNSALLAQHGLSRDSASPANGRFNDSHVSHIWGDQNTTSTSVGAQAPTSTRSPGARYNAFGTYGESPVGLRDGATTSAGLANFGHTVINPGLGHTGPSGGNSLGGQGIWSSGASATHQHRASPWPHETPAPASSIGFSHPSSLYAGTPSAVRTGPANAVACNGNYYNATTPFSRLGEGVNNREDPTHFRNKLKAVTGTSELSYDGQIMHAAFMDNNYKPRPK